MDPHVFDSLTCDADLSRFRSVKRFPDRRNGTLVPGMRKKPTESFRAVADYLADH
jgi:hypothetical protein